MPQVHPNLDPDPEAPMREIAKLIAENPGTLTFAKVLELQPRIQALVPLGIYNGPDYGCRVTGVKFHARREFKCEIAKLYVEFDSAKSAKKQRMPILLFLESHRLMAKDMAS
jgi:hypothetical protein